MSATSLDLSQIKTDALSAASSFRTLIGLGSGNTPTFLGTLLTGGTVTASAPLIDATQTWNSAGTVFTGLRLNVTDTASSSSSLLMDLQVGGSSRFNVSKAGNIATGRLINPGTQAEPSYAPSDNGQTGFWCPTNGVIAFGGTSRAVQFSFAANGNLRIGYSGTLSFFSGAAATDAFTLGDTVLTRDAAQTLAQRNAGNAQTFRIYNTFTDASNYERGKLEWASNVLRIGTEKAGTGSARALELQTDGTTRLTIGTTGLATFTSDVWTSGDFRVSSTKYFYWQSRSTIRSPADGLICLANAAENDFGRIQLGGTTSSFPAIKRNAAALNFRLADDSADCDITAAALTLSGNLTISTKNIVTDTTTGTKIGTGITQKLAFWNATPVVQPTAVADATDAASVITQLNALLTRMRNLGLIAT
jgi:hypothetical protein